MKTDQVFSLLSQCEIGAIFVAEDYRILEMNDYAERMIRLKYQHDIKGQKLNELFPELCEDPKEKHYIKLAFGIYIARCKEPELPALPPGIHLYTFKDESIEVKKNCYENVLEQINDSIIMCDEDSQISFMNNASVKMDGLSLNDVLGEGIANVYEATDGKGLIVPRAIRERKVFLERRQYYTTKFNKNIDITANTYPIVKHGKVLGGYSVMRDWSTVDKLSKRIVELQEKLIERENPEFRKTTGHSSLSAKYHFEDIIHVSNKVTLMLEKCKQAALSDSPVMIYGETGTGKELLAQSIHNASRRKDGPFLAINCAAIPENLLESLLFGTEKGAYTGAEHRKGYFEQANKGTLLLDELNSMNINLQAKLLRVLQDGTIRHVGGLKDIKVNVRIISNLNIPPMEAVEKKIIREDLYYRLGVVNIGIPALRERKEDIHLLGKYFMMKFNEQFDRNIRGFNPDTMEVLQAYHWPGNVRELEHVIEHAMNVLPLDRELISPEYIPGYILDRVGQAKIKEDIPIKETVASSSGSLNQTMKNLERESIIDILRELDGNISESARRLKMSRQSLQYRIKKYKIDLSEFK